MKIELTQEMISKLDWWIDQRPHEEHTYETALEKLLEEVDCTHIESFEDWAERMGLMMEPK